MLDCISMSLPRVPPVHRGCVQHLLQLHLKPFPPSLIMYGAPSRAACYSFRNVCSSRGFGQNTDKEHIQAGRIFSGGWKGGRKRRSCGRWFAIFVHPLGCEEGNLVLSYPWTTRRSFPRRGKYPVNYHYVLLLSSLIFPADAAKLLGPRVGNW